MTTLRPCQARCPENESSALVDPSGDSSLVDRFFNTGNFLFWSERFSPPRCPRCPSLSSVFRTRRPGAKRLAPRSLAGGLWPCSTARPYVCCSCQGALGDGDPAIWVPKVSLMFWMFFLEVTIGLLWVKAFKQFTRNDRFDARFVLPCHENNHHPRPATGGTRLPRAKLAMVGSKQLDVPRIYSEPTGLRAYLRFEGVGVGARSGQEGPNSFGGTWSPIG